jgi:hypothetical protein
MELALTRTDKLHRASRIFLIGSLFLCATFAIAQSAEKEPSVVVELGTTADRSFTEGQTSLGPTLAVEVTPIEKWLELEAGDASISAALYRMECRPTF